MIYTTLEILRNYTFYDEVKGKEVPRYLHDLKKLKIYTRNNQGDIPLTDVVRACGVFHAKWVLEQGLIVGEVDKYHKRVLYTFKNQRLRELEDFYGDSSFSVFLNRWHFLMFNGEHDLLETVIQGCEERRTEMWTKLWYEDSDKAIQIRDAYIKRQGEILIELLERIW